MTIDSPPRGSTEDRPEAWPVRLLRRIGRRVFAVPDAHARHHGWRIEERRCGLRRVYRDPRFDARRARRARSRAVS